MLLFYTPLARWSPHPERTPSAQRGAEVDAGLCMLSHAESTSSAPHHLAWALGFCEYRMMGYYKSVRNQSK